MKKSQSLVHLWPSCFIFLKPYIQLARLDKPVGAWLLLWPCWWGLFLAEPAIWPWKNLLLFFLGTILLRGAGCTYNDIVDRDIDTRVKRTAQRPLVLKSLSINNAWIFLIFQLLLGFIVLCQFSETVRIIGVSSLVLVALYPWMKRLTYWPQLFLGLAFNWGIFMGWAVIKPVVHPAPFILYAAGICWTLGYDTIYALQDREDDQRTGVKSLALRFSHNIKTFLTIVYGLMMSCLIGLGQIQHYGKIYYGCLSILALHLSWQVISLDPELPVDCHQKFKSNVLTGGLICLILSLATL